MSVVPIVVEAFLEMAHNGLIFDVRSPNEFQHAHIPCAINLPLFTDEERAAVGTIYKQVSRQDAIKIGLEYFGPKMRAMVEVVESKVEELSWISSDNQSHQNDKPIILVHCWRGGMRSSAVAWLLDLYGFKVYLLEGGYKKYRNWVLNIFQQDYSINVLGGYTGSGKTMILQELSRQGLAVIDLENLACHKGSTFGHIGLPDQPSQEMFENQLATELYNIKPNQSIWFEDESQRIGRVNLPINLWDTIAKSKLIFLDIPFEQRLDNLVMEYGKLDNESMVAAIERIEKRLGGLETKNAIQFLNDGNTKDSFRILLNYYDKWYLKGLNRRNNLNELMNVIECASVDFKENCCKVLSCEVADVSIT